MTRNAVTHVLLLVTLRCDDADNARVPSDLQYYDEIYALGIYLSPILSRLRKFIIITFKTLYKPEF